MCSVDDYELRKWNVPLEISDCECCATCAKYRFSTGGDSGSFFSSEPYAGFSECTWRGSNVMPYNVCGM